MVVMQPKFTRVEEPTLLCNQVSADSGFFSVHNLEVLEERGIDAYVPDSNMACVLNRGGMLKQPARHPAQLRMRSKLCSTTGRALYRRRKALAEPVIGKSSAECGGSGCAGWEKSPRNWRWQRPR